MSFTNPYAELLNDTKSWINFFMNKFYDKTLYHNMHFTVFNTSHSTNSYHCCQSGIDYAAPQTPQHCVRREHGTKESSIAGVAGFSLPHISHATSAQVLNAIVQRSELYAQVAACARTASAQQINLFISNFKQPDYLKLVLWAMGQCCWVYVGLSHILAATCEFELEYHHSTLGSGRIC